jgi:hypothetical protein
MGYFAEINDDNTVIRIISVSNDDLGEPTLEFPETESAGRAFIANKLKLPGRWLQCSFNSSFRGCYPGPSYTYDPDLDEFVPPVVVEVDDE